MAKLFTTSEWKKIFSELEGKEKEYGLPIRDDESLVLGSWNIRKFGEINPKKRDDNHFRFISKAASHFDLLAVQEVMDDLGSVRRLRDELNANISDPSKQYGLVLSDITGAMPGGEGMQERLAILYKRDRIRRTEVASDISIDRGPVLKFLRGEVGKYVESLVDLIDDHEKSRKTLLKWAKEWAKKGKRKKTPKTPKLEFASFLTFVRSPYCVSFQFGPSSSNPYEIMAVAAHLVFGTPEQRKLEFNALMSWLSNRVVKKKRAYYQNFLLMGDLNLDIDTEKERIEVDNSIKDIAKNISSKGNNTDIYFPFITPHPDNPDKETFRSNARLTQTYDHIGFFTTDSRLPQAINRHNPGVPGALKDYGLFNFTDLFARAVYNKPFKEMKKGEATKLIRRFEHTVSDHLPIWVRLEMPD